jgi:hypothetical protein
MFNPFYNDGPIKPEAKIPTMVWRNHFLDELTKDVSEAMHPLIVGSRQSGKTTLAYQLINKLHNRREKDCIAIYIDSSSLVGATETNVVSHFIKTIIEFIKRSESKIVNEDFLETLHNYTGRQPVTFYDYSRFLDDFCSSVLNIFRIVLVFDEIEVLPDKLLYGVLNVFRSIATKSQFQHDSPCYSIVILCHRNLTEFDLGLGSPYNVNVKTRRIEDLTLQELNEMLDGTHAGSVIGKKFSDEAIDFIYRETSGHPYLVQRLCHQAVEMIEHKSNMINIKDVIHVSMWLFEKGDRNLRITIDSVSNTTYGEEIVIHDLLKGKMIPFERILPSIRNLEYKGIIKEDKESRLCVFRAKIYEQLFLNKYFNRLNPLDGKHIKEDATLLLRISEIQSLLLNEKLYKSIKAELSKNTHQDMHRSISMCLMNLYESSKLRLHLEIIKESLRYWKTEINTTSIDYEKILNILSLLYLEYFEMETVAGKNGNQ